MPNDLDRAGSPSPGLLEPLRRAATALRRAPELLAGWLLLHALLAAWLLGPAQAALLAALRRAGGGRVVLGNEEIAAFLLRPSGWIFIVLAIGLGVALGLTNLAGSLLVTASLASGIRLHPIAVLAAVARRARPLLVIGFAHGVALPVVALPTLGVAALATLALIGDRDPNGWIAERPPAFHTAILIAIPLALCWSTLTALLLARWSLALPAVLVEGLDGWSALRRSRDLVRGAVWRVVLPPLLWIAALAAATLLLLTGLRGIGGAVLPGLDGSPRSAALVAGLLVAAAAAISTLGSAITAGGLGAIAWALHESRRRAVEGGAAATPRWPEPVVRRRGLAWATIVGGAAATGAATLWLVDAIGVEDDLLVVAHRGASARAPENTLAAIRAAVEDGADFVEIDVQLLADGTVAVIHDADLGRVAGRPDLRVRDLVAADLPRHNVGSWFDPAFAAERIPTLDEALDVVLPAGRGLNVELKFVGGDDALGPAAIAVLQRRDATKRCVVTSLDAGRLLALREIDPDVELGAILTVVSGNAAQVGTDFLSLHAPNATADLVSRAHARGLAIHVWTVNDEAAISRMCDRGVDALITDHPDRARRVLERRAELTDVERLLLRTRNFLGG